MTPNDEEVAPEQVEEEKDLGVFLTIVIFDYYFFSKHAVKCAKESSLLGIIKRTLQK